MILQLRFRYLQIVQNPYWEIMCSLHSCLLFLVTLVHVGCQDDSGFSVLWETVKQDVQ
jgi:hypothetical protein